LDTYNLRLNGSRGKLFILVQEKGS
jgi:hypothetical protein